MPPEHDCMQKARIERHEQMLSDGNRLLGILEAGAKTLNDQWARLDKRLNGAFTAMTEHVADGDNWRARIVALEKVLELASKEKLNTTKASQYRISLITGILCSLPGWLIAIWLIFKAFANKAIGG